MKTCIRCKETKAESEFNWRNIKRGYIQSICKSCQREQGKERYAKNPQAVKQLNRTARLKMIEEARKFVHEFLCSSMCSDCGTKDISVLTFHHTDIKRMNVSDMVAQGYAVSTIRRELERTIVLCWNCHMKREHNKRGGRYKDLS